LFLSQENLVYKLGNINPLLFRVFSMASCWIWTGPFHLFKCDETRLKLRRPWAISPCVLAHNLETILCHPCFVN
jgi:hypothetical protein